MSRTSSLAFCLISLVLERSPDEAKIAYATRVDGNWEIFVVNDDGSARAQLTTRRSQERFPLWSPDRTRLAYGAQVGSEWNWELWLMDADGQNPRRLVSDIIAKGTRGWSPDGSRILLAAHVNGDAEILTVAAATGNITRLTSSAGEDRDPCWSPDGRVIAFSSIRDGNFELYIMRADGTGLRRLTNNKTHDGSPAWSPDGSKIAFVSGAQGKRDIYFARVADGQVERLTNGAHVTNDVSKWSPDGSQLAVQVAHGKNYDIEVVHVSGERRRVASSPEFDGQYSWSPDSRRLAFISEQKNATGVYVVDVVSGRTRRIAAGASLNPAWAN